LPPAALSAASRRAYRVKARLSARAASSSVQNRNGTYRS
jgi:hypothetical protein